MANLSCLVQETENTLVPGDTMHNAQGSKGKTENTECKNGALAKSLVRSNYTLRYSVLKNTVIDDLTLWVPRGRLNLGCWPTRGAFVNGQKDRKVVCGHPHFKLFRWEKEKRDARRRDPSIVRWTTDPVLSHVSSRECQMSFILSWSTCIYLQHGNAVRSSI